MKTPVTRSSWIDVVEKGSLTSAKTIKEMDSAGFESIKQCCLGTGEFWLGEFMSLTSSEGYGIKRYGEHLSGVG